MAIEWTPDLAVGVDKIDEQHKMLYEEVNKLFEACRHGQAKEVIGDMLSFLKEYTQKHFKDEEKYMQSIDYPGYLKHKKLHDNFILELEKINNEYSQSGNSLVIIVSVNSMIVNWLNYHIFIEDKKIGRFATYNR